jgi:ABC-type nickel/cobalt efflux system permease component RcnA
MTRLIVLIVAVVVILGLTLPGPARADPFSGKPDAAAKTSPFSKEPSPAAADEPAEAGRAWGPIAFIGRALLTFQREANRMIAQNMRAIRQGETSMPLLIGIGLAFLYGVVHALGPGHGKIVVVSYFLSRDARIMRGFLMGLQIAVFHVLSAMVVVALADLVLRRAFGSAPAEVAGVRLASYGLIGLIGMVMLAQAVHRSYLRRQGALVSYACCDHGHQADHHGHAWPETGARAREGALSLGVGLVPCTGAVLILLYALANGIVFAGVLLVVAIAAGMAITMGALGVLSVVARNAVATRIERAGDGDGGTLTVVSDYGGALLITLIGGALFWSAW